MNLTDAQLEVLAMLVESGPIKNRGVIRGPLIDLIEAKYAVDIIMLGEEGFSASTTKGMEVYCEYFAATNLRDAKVNRLTLRP